MSLRSAVASVLAGLILVVVSSFWSGIAAYDRDVFFEVIPVKYKDVSTMMYTVKIDRALGRDRTLFSSSQPGGAWQFLQAYKQMLNPPKQFNFVMPTPKDGGP